MNCPVCAYSNLIKKETSDGLQIFHCEKCDGHCLKYMDYQAWLKNHPAIEQDKNGADYTPQFDTKEAKLCPDCSRILIKYKVDKDSDFYLDYCKACGSVWFDKNEYEFIKSKNLHDKIYQFFTADWQKNLKNSELQGNLKQQYVDRFGESDYKKIKEFREWMNSHEKSRYIKTYLLDDDPYSI